MIPNTIPFACDDIDDGLLNEILADMGACAQNSTQSVREHCEAVCEASYALWDYIQTGDESKLTGFRVPEWFKSYREDFKRTLAPIEFITIYTGMHDCGKPYCRVEGADGKVHFENHASWSAQVWDDLKVKDAELNQRVRQLILRDMKIHTIKPNEVEEFAAFEDAPTLMLAGLAEIHANAKMFGGIESDSFKIKYAQIERRGKQICKKLYASK